MNNNLRFRRFKGAWSRVGAGAAENAPQHGGEGSPQLPAATTPTFNWALRAQATYREGHLQPGTCNVSDLDWIRLDWIVFDGIGLD